MSLESAPIYINSELREELLMMRDEDQATRFSKNPNFEIDIKNTARMKEIVDTFGFPTISKVGLDGYSAAWLIIQHADMDLPFQEECLKILKAQPPHEVRAKEIAYLEDRIRVSRGLPQRYGTQFKKSVNGKLVPRPIEDDTLVNTYRAEVGLPSIEEYTQIMNESD